MTIAVRGRGHFGSTAVDNWQKKISSCHNEQIFKAEESNFYSIISGYINLDDTLWTLSYAYGILSSLLTDDRLNSVGNIFNTLCSFLTLKKLEKGALHSRTN